MSDTEQTERSIREGTPGDKSETTTSPLSSPLAIRTVKEHDIPTHTPQPTIPSEDNIVSPDHQAPPLDELSEQPLQLPMIEPLDTGNDSEQESEQDSALGAEAASSTLSVSSSVLQFQRVHDRTYHSAKFDSNYWGANDPRQLDTQELQGHVFAVLLDEKLCHAELPEKMDKVLDLGSGSGKWAIDFADEHPEVEVTGVDISPVQPEYLPPNVKFEIDDFNRSFTWTENSFDFAHLRWLVGSVKDWAGLFGQVCRVLKPGGVVESFDCDTYIQSDDNTVAPRSYLARWGGIFTRGFPGTPFRVVSDDLQRRGLEQAGFEIIGQKTYKIPLSEWPLNAKEKHIGLMSRTAIENDIVGIIGRSTAEMGWSKEETELFAAGVRKELRDRKVHGWYLAKAVWARKPVDA